ncbi:hypothetical protein CO731_04963 [Aminobacter sp. MSH1]|uniref:Uncharacterized protein n=1 Tax=Aminobacter niigataensis TaxID=83265 RepID=A0ABR6L8X8_9HYPH|nr:hypothetical protein CO731_04963 [Aminobacter sp. MSH1]MBB4653269.1 hypothetical protein [Aminobacter niigataensis]
MSKEDVRSPQHQPLSVDYDGDCQDALAAHLDKLLDNAEAAGWVRTTAAAALMYLSAKRLKPVS